MSGMDGAGDEFFIAGGTLRYNAQSYVRRQADDEVIKALLAGRFCNVLTPRQMGKSSLMVRASRFLEEQGIATVVVDLTSIGTESTPDQWYQSILNNVARKVCPGLDVTAWWQQHASATYMQRFTDFFMMMMQQAPGRVVVFVDEIDATLSLDFCDDFFAGIRALYNARPFTPALERLSFVLLGVASPDELIKDSTRTPYNIGQGILLNEFGWDDSAVLRSGLEAAYPGQGEGIFQRIYSWTNGHPYLTQKLCQAVVEKGGERWTDAAVDEVVHSLFLAEKARNELNIKFVQRRLLSYPRKNELLGLYMQVASGKRVRHDGQSVLQNELKLAGIVKEVDGFLQIRNRIYQRVFDTAWVRQNLPTPWGTIALAVLTILVVVFVSITLYDTVYLPAQADNAVASFHQDRDPANRARQLARISGLRGVLFNPGYEQESVEMFYELGGEDQWALFDDHGPITPQTCADRLALARGLYTSMVDVELSGASDAFLFQMWASLKPCEEDQRAGEEADRLRQEIALWRTARRFARSGDVAGAVEQLSAALAKNPTNRAVLYERAFWNTRLGDYEAALTDLEAILSGVASVPATNTPENTPTGAPTGALGTPSPPGAAAAAPTQTATQTVRPTETQEGGLIGGTRTPVALTPVALTPDPDPFSEDGLETGGSGAPREAVTGLTSSADWLSAVQRLVNQNRGFYVYLQTFGPAGPTFPVYPSLTRFGVLPDVAATSAAGQVLTQTAQAVSLPVETAAAIPIPTLGPADGAGTRLIYSAWNGEKGGYDLVVAGLDNSDPRVIPGGGELDQVGASTSPDGTLIAFIARRLNESNPDQYELYVSNADGSGQERLLYGQGNTDFDRVRWSPNGRYLAFAAGQTGANGDTKWDIYLYDRQTFTNCQITAGENQYSFPDWLDDRTIIAQLNKNGLVKISNLDGCDASNVSIQQVQLAGLPVSYGIMHPAVYAGGGEALVTFTGYLTGEDSQDIFVYDLNNEVLTQLTQGESLAATPAWGPGGQTLYFSTLSSLDRVNRNGSDRQQYSNEGKAIFYSFVGQFNPGQP